MATNAVTLASKFNLAPQFQSGKVSKSVFTVDATALTLFASGNTDNVTIADIPAGSCIIGGMISIKSATTNATGTCTAALIAGGASGTTMVAATDTKTVAAAGGSMANTLTVAAASTLVLQFITATASNTVNPVVEVTVYFVA